MNHPEKEYISLCKRLIEEKLKLTNDSGVLRQRDLEYLADAIEEKSGMKLSLSTLKRLWRKNYDQTPHASTLQALVSILGYRDWHEFKSKEVVVPDRTKVKKINAHLIEWWMAFPVALVLIVVLWLIAFRSDKQAKRKPVIHGDVLFTGNKTVAQGVPSTIIFNYDVKNVDADSFFFQQAWNDAEKVRIDPKGHYYSNIYYYPGFHKAKLIANDSIIKRFRVHVTTNGWLPLVRYSLMDKLPVYLKSGKFVRDGCLRVTKQELVSSNVNVDRDFVLSYYNVRDFGNVQSDNFSFDTQVSCDSGNAVACHGVEVVIMCEAHIFFVRLMGKGCERDVGIKMGEIFQDGVHNDLSRLGRNLYQPQHLQVKVVNKTATVYLDDQPVYTIRFTNDFGKVVGLSYNFIGTGAIDYVQLSNEKRQTVYEEQFDE